MNTTKHHTNKLNFRNEVSKKLLTLVFAMSIACFTQAQNCIVNTNSLSFNDSTTYLSIANQTNLNIADSITIEAWINANSFNVGGVALNTIVCKHGISAGKEGFVLRCGGTGELSFTIAGNTVPVAWQEVVSPSAALSLNIWTHVAGTFDGQNSKLYINGNLVATFAFTGSIVTSSAYPLTIGKFSDPAQPSARFFDGLIDEVKVWNRALSAAELTANMNKHIDPVTSLGLVSYWRFNEGTGTTAQDLKSGNDATLNNNVWDTLVPFNVVFPPVPTITYSLGMLTSSATANIQWILNGTFIPGANSVNYTPTVNGSYTVMVANTEGCTATSLVYTVNDVGINQLENNFTVNVFPNPMVDDAVISINAKESIANVNFMILDVCGKVIENKINWALRAGKNQIYISKKNMSSGIYFYHLVKDNNTVLRGKIVVE